MITITCGCGRSSRRVPARRVADEGAGDGAGRAPPRFAAFLTFTPASQRTLVEQLLLDLAARPDDFSTANEWCRLRRHGASRARPAVRADPAI
jgi:hypothetical protein